MECVEISEFGGPEVLRKVTRNRPTPGAKEILIKVAAAGVNRGDSVQRRGNYPPPNGASDLPGLEVSGTVLEVGEDVTRYAVGDRVCALLPGGGYSTHCVAPEGLCLPVPAGISLIDAACFPETIFTVYDTVWNQAQLQPGEVLLVHGGASGIGTMAIQMARALGHRVFVTAGGASRCSACEALGAEAIDYHSSQFETVIKDAIPRGVDVVLDMVGGDYVARELSVLAEGGRIVFIATLGGKNGSIDIRAMMHKRLKLMGSTLRSRSNEYKGDLARQVHAHIWPLIEKKLINPVVDRVFDLHDAAQAHDYLDAGKQVGKILLKMGVVA
ncbi:NAD(P)H-quinone oxidoreductase [Cupriavidus numazuensis]|nr:NAD(P)H-quinone oxidoreductase [Cupriavidus numazuensis]